MKISYRCKNAKIDRPLSERKWAWTFFISRSIFLSQNGRKEKKKWKSLFFLSAVETKRTINIFYVNFIIISVKCLENTFRDSIFPFHTLFSRKSKKEKEFPTSIKISLPSSRNFCTFLFHYDKMFVYPEGRSHVASFSCWGKKDGFRDLVIILRFSCHEKEK